MLTVGSLFSGIGGFDFGLERAGMLVIWQVEIDDACNRVLERRFPGVQRFRDIRTVGGELRPVDLICGGFPCTDLSVAGKRKGLAGEQSSLWFEFLRLISELHPRWVVVENVPGLLSSNGGADFATILRGLVKCGYGVCWRILDAQYFRVAQRRRRVFIVGSLGNGRAAQVLFESEGGGWHPPPSRKAGQRVAPNLTAGSPGTSNQAGRRREDDVNLVAAPLTTNVYADRAAEEASLVIGHSLCAEGADASEDGTGREVPMVFDWQSGGDVRLNISDMPSALQASQVSAIAFTERSRKDGRTFEAQEELTYALMNPGSGGRTHSRQIATGTMVRRLTPTECERLMGFPDNHTAYDAEDKPISDSARYRMLGNAVVVPVAEWLGRRIIECDGSGREYDVDEAGRLGRADRIFTGTP